MIEFLGSDSGVLYLVTVMFLALAVGAFFINRSRKKRYLGQIVVSLSLLAISILFLIMTIAFPRMGGAGNDAAMVPRLWIFILIPTSMYILYRAVKGLDEPDAKFGRVDKVLFTASALIISIIAINYLGYYISSALFILVCMFLLGYRKYVTMLVISGAWVLFSYTVFYKMLYVALPVGKLFQSLLLK